MQTFLGEKPVQMKYENEVSGVFKKMPTHLEEESELINYENAGSRVY